MTTHLTLVVFLLSFSTVILTESDRSHPKKYAQVKLPDGTIRGLVKPNDFNGKYYYSFEGIPYAKPPIGRLRFKEPEPVDPWDGVLDTMNSNINCPQGRLHDFNETEDCLTANIYVPGPPSETKRAVLVYVFGGGFVEGGVSSDGTSPEYLMDNDIIVATFNYRLGLLGYLKLNDPKLGIHGNNGMRDQVLFLKWVQKNIGYFGGNSNQVVVAGCSTGAVAVHALVLSPMTKGLFHGAILQSGNFFHHIRHIPAIQVAQRHDPSIKTEEEALQLFNSSDTKTLHEMITRIIFRGFAVVGVEIEEPHSPDPFMPKCITEIIEKREYNDIPILVGYNSFEAIEYRPHYGVENFIENVARDFVLGVIYGTCDGNVTQKLNVLKNYYYNSTQMAHIPEVLRFCTFITDFIFLIPFIDSIDMHFRHVSSPVYVYRFDLDTKLNYIKNREKIFDVEGASHADELGYLFKMDVTPEWKRGDSKEEIGLHNFQTLWTNFIKTSNPNHPKEDIFEENPNNDRFLPLDKFTTLINHLNINLNLKMEKDIPERNRAEFWKRMRARHTYQCCKTKSGF